MPQLFNHPPDTSEDFFKLENEYYVAGAVKDFDAEKAEGAIEWNYHSRVADISFNQMNTHLEKQDKRETFLQQYDVNPKCHFSLSFITARTFRLRIRTTNAPQIEYPSLMLDGEPATSNAWQIATNTAEKIIYKSDHGSLEINKLDFKLSTYDTDDNLLTSTQGPEILKAQHPKTLPLIFIRRTSDRSRSIAASISLLQDEKIYGCGESFTSLNKRGQKIALWSTDTQSAATKEMYKPIPFFISSKGYGIFLHTSTPTTFDFGNTNAGSTVLYNGDDQLDLFFFIGTPKEILSEYTAVTGRSPLPPLWSFGLWMSRFTYQSQKEVKEIADKLRQHRIPCDVIHIDAGWFKHGIDCDYEFDKNNFPDPKAMMNNLRKDGFRTSLWQIPYYTPQNPLFSEVVEDKLYVKDNKGDLPTEDGILDFSNYDVQEWYRQKIKPLLEMGASVIKADFGEAAPLNGYYASGRSGFYEHNLFPLRYTQLLHSITKEITGEDIIWARSAWAGSQRYPVHWSGDPEVSDTAMAGTLRAGLSLGLSGFCFWSHDIGGFSSSPKEDLFKRWALFGLLSSHSRIHGFPPREPWEFGEAFLNIFRKIAELKYRLMPYVYTQAALCSKNGWPLLKALLLNYPDDPIAWYIEDQYLFGDDILVAPLLEENKNSRLVYLPKDKWIDYQTKEIYQGGQWIEIQAGDIPGIILVRHGSLIPHISLAQSTVFMDWSNIELVAFTSHDDIAKGDYYFQAAKNIVGLEAHYMQDEWRLMNDSNNEQIKFTVKGFEE